MPGRKEVPEEAGKAIMDRWADASLEFHGDEAKVAQALAKAAAPAIRNQERQRIQEALEGLGRFESDADYPGCVKTTEDAEYIDRDEALAALDTLEADRG